MPAFNTTLAELVAYYLLGILFFSSGLALYFQNRRSAVNRLWALFMITMATWVALGAYMMILVPHPVQYRWAQMALVIQCGPLFFLFCRRLGNESKPLDRAEWVVTLVGIILSLYFLSRFIWPRPSTFLPYEFKILDKKPVSSPGLLYLVYTAYSLVVDLWAIASLYRGIRRCTNPVEKKLMKFIFFVITTGFIGIVVGINIANLLEIEQPLHPIVVLVFINVMVAYSILRHRAWRIEYLLGVIQDKEQALSERNKAIEAELDMARLIQSNLMPARMPGFQNISLGAAFAPMDKVGGDFYDFYLHSNTLGIFVADVAGHGIPGAFLASATKMSFENRAAQREDCSHLLTMMDHDLSKRSVEAMFVTAFYAEIDYDGSRLTYANAGHTPVILQRTVDDEHQFSFLRPSGPPLGLGLTRRKTPKLARQKLQAGDRLVFYTDGLVENRNHEGEYFESRLAGFLKKYRSKSAQQLPGLLLDEVLSFSRQGLEDDLTIVVADIE